MAVRVHDDYWNLVRRLPLVPIRDGRHLREASRVVTELAARVDELTEGEREYFAVLTDLMAGYEKKHKTVRRQKMTPADALRTLMDEHGFTQKALAEKLRISRTVLVEFLNEKRGLSKASALKLSSYFKVSPELFLSGGHTV